ncbi:prepilin-type N-terminal cleavage/methylation domain-containing protein [Candidatus Sumerlaeota bacterium]|nr:prepilin-type N-terminal cleavage/methylation domain-containing protein [Candidatus Sumerlaeota bacterium]
MMRNKRPQVRPLRRGVTLLELVVVILIITILSTIATNVYTGQVQRAKVAATRSTIRDLSVAVVRYEIDTGELPLSGSGTVTLTGNIPTAVGRTYPIPNMSSVNNRDGCGFLYLELVHSLSGNSSQRYPTTWGGPYIEFNASIIKTKDDTGTDLVPGMVQILDSFGAPFEFINHLEYNPAVPLPLNKHFDVTGVPNYPGGQGTEDFGALKPLSAQPELPSPNPFLATETYYNPQTYQIYSVGLNGQTFDNVVPPSDDTAANQFGTKYRGTEYDDVNNFGF